jgi:hypothetical protein
MEPLFLQRNYCKDCSISRGKARAELALSLGYPFASVASNKDDVGEFKRPNIRYYGIVFSKFRQDEATVWCVLGWMSWEAPGKSDGCIEDKLCHQ